MRTPHDDEAYIAKLERREFFWEITAMVGWTLAIVGWMGHYLNWSLCS